jgi:hypothetical protein
MARHYYRTNVPLPVMILWWGFLGVCFVIFMIYDAIFKAPERRAQAEAQTTWDRQHFNGWKLEQKYPSQGDIEHGLFFDRYDGKTCTTKGYPGYDPCPAQQYYSNGVLSAPPAETPDDVPRKPVKKRR